MKIKKVHIISLLVIQIALASTLTTVNATRLRLPATYKAYYIQIDTAETGDCSNSFFDSIRIGNVLHQASTPFELDPYGSCSTDNNHICVAEIAYEANGNPSSGCVSDFKTGDNPLE